MQKLNYINSVLLYRFLKVSAFPGCSHISFWSCTLWTYFLLLCWIQAISYDYLHYSFP